MSILLVFAIFPNISSIRPVVCLLLANQSRHAAQAVEFLPRSCTTLLLWVLVWGFQGKCDAIQRATKLKNTNNNIAADTNYFREKEFFKVVRIGDRLFAQ